MNRQGSEGTTSQYLSFGVGLAYSIIYRLKGGRQPRDKPGIGIAFGSTGAGQGLAHIGVLQVLESEGIKASMWLVPVCGSLIGALFAAGVDLHRLEQVACSIRLKHIVDFGVFPGKAELCRGKTARGAKCISPGGRLSLILKLPLQLLPLI